MTEIKIEKKIPTPAPRTKYPFDKMEIGDSFCVPEGKRATVCTAARYHGIKLRSKKQPDGTVRVWRIA